MTSQHILETVTFKIHDHISQNQFMVLAEKFNEYLNECDGFISRRLSLTESGRWVDIVEWEDLKFAKSSASKFWDDPVAVDFTEAIDGLSVSIKYSRLQLSCITV